MKTKSYFSKKICIACKERRERFRFRGDVMWDKDHKVMFQVLSPPGR